MVNAGRGSAECAASEAAPELSRHDAGATPSGPDGLGARIERAVSGLKRVAERASLDFALEVGRVVVEALYDGDLRTWRLRRKKDHALRSLASHSDLPLSAPALYRALAVYELSERCGLCCRSWVHVGLSHVRAVFNLDPVVQKELLDRAERERWSVVQLERETRKYRDAGRKLGGRKCVPAYLKSIKRIHELTAPAALDGLEGCRSLDAATLLDLRTKLGEVQSRLANIERLLPGSVATPERTPARR